MKRYETPMIEITTLHHDEIIMVSSLIDKNPTPGSQSGASIKTLGLNY
ncbi:MAG: hypothetical protein IJS61_09870 [Firmicutes bacterium]|nr:hypothetical protein [Bacillota bacterium]